MGKKKAQDQVVTRPQMEADWSIGTVAGIILATVGALIFALAGQMVPEFPKGISVAVAAVIGLVTILRHRHRQHPLRNGVFRAVAWLAGSGWATFTAYTDWSVTGMIVLGLGMFAVIGLSTMFAPPKPVTVAGDNTGHTETVISFQSPEFKDLLRSLIINQCNLKPGQFPYVDKIKDWKGEGGEVTGHSWMIESAPYTVLGTERIQGIQGDLAIMLRLPRGCAAIAEPAGTHQGATILHISTVNDMHKDIPYPTNYHPRSIINDSALGLLMNKEAAMYEVYQSSGLICGVRGGGKTVLLHVMTANTVQCTDAIACHVDLNGGALSTAWVAPYARGEVPESVIGWFACGPASTIAMCEALVRIAMGRKSVYQEMMLIHNADILPLGNGRDICHECDMVHPPAIVVYVDEGGELMGETAMNVRKAAEKLAELQRIARAMCVNVVFSAQRAVSDYVPTSVKEMALLSICTKVASQKELGFLFDWDRGISKDNLVHAGQIYMRRGSSAAIMMAKVFSLKPAQIREIALTAWKWVPEWDPAAVEDGGKEFANRWEHPEVKHFMERLRGKKGPSLAAAAPAGGGGTATMTVNTRGLRSAGDALNMLQDALDDDLDEAGAGGDDQGFFDKQFATIADTLPDLPAWPGSPGENPPAASQPLVTARPSDIGPAARYKFVSDLLHAQGPRGMKTSEVIAAARQAGYITDRAATINETLTSLRNAGDAVQRTGEQGMWWHRDYAAS